MAVKAACVWSLAGDTYRRLVIHANFGTTAYDMSCAVCERVCRHSQCIVSKITGKRATQNWSENALNVC